jgi:outer membrane protein OmpA-like peptidoglycan-associated protein
LSDDDLRVDFQPGEAVIPGGETAKLDRIVGRLTDNSDLRIELRAFATSHADSTSMARRVSLARALAIKSYLTSRGIPDERIDVRALGSSPSDASDRVDLFLMR